MREVYWAHFEVRGGLVEARGIEHVSPASEVMLPELAGDAWAAAGRGLAISAQLAERCRSAAATLYPDLLPRAQEVLTLARPLVASGRVVAAEGALPVYVRDRVVNTGPS